MTKADHGYANPLTVRYASPAMQSTFSAYNRGRLWRKLWAALAESEHELGFPVSAEQVAELKSNIDVVDLEAVARYESESRHEVMAHIRAWGEVCPKAAPIIHLGATSAFVMDNSDILQAAEALQRIENQLVHVLFQLRNRAQQLKDLPVLGYTHFQPAQLTTFGKRICMWAQDFLWDLLAVRRFLSDLPFLGMKGATGTAASVVALCDGDTDKALKLDRLVAQKLGFKRLLTIAGQTYTRKLDCDIYHLLASIAQSSSKMAHDMRLMQHTGEAMEPFRGKQVGSSAMPYKRNPMASERVCALARHLISLAANGYHTASTQWLERSLDDSANKRISIPEAFLTADSILHHVHDIAAGFEVVPGRIRAEIDRNLPFIATENILMAAVKAGGNRQELHERIREHSIAASRRIMDGASDNDLLSRLASDEAFAGIVGMLDRHLDPSAYIGLAPKQVEIFIAQELDPALPLELPAFPWDREVKV
ncbi:MAG: adenylosuccinate lyase [Planctomycetota bacterium]